jgi:peptide/nickel transport system permease protein
MLSYILNRIIRMVPQLFLISVLAFILVQLPPGDYLTQYIQNREASGSDVTQEEIARLKNTYGLDKPMYQQYLKWIGNIVTKFDFGYSFQFSRNVSDVIVPRMGMTFFIALLAHLVTWSIALPVGIYIAIKQYSFADYFWTFIGFIGIATPSFLIALVLMYLAVTKLGIQVGGLYSPEYMIAPWSWGKFVNLLEHIWLPAVIVGLSGTGYTIRTLRATMLDELRKQYAMVARSKGLSELSVLIKYPIRIAINPIISTVGWLLVWFFSGGTVVEIVLNLDTAGPALWRSLLGQDMFVAGAYILITGFLYAIGSLVSDLLLAVVDPRVRFGSVEGL